MGRRKPARSKKDKDKDYMSEMEMCESQDDDYDDEDINKPTANSLERRNEGHEENTDKDKMGNLRILTVSSDNAIFRHEVSTPISETVITTLDESSNSSRATRGLQTITEESACTDQHTAEKFKTRTPLIAEGQHLLHERFVSRCNEDILPRPLMNAHSRMDENGNDRQRTRQHNGPEKDIFRRPKRNMENLHYQNTRFQDFPDFSGQGDRAPDRSQYLLHARYRNDDMPVKKPNDINEAVYLVVECLCERRSSKFKEPYERRMQKNIRRASPLYECSNSETEIEEEEEETCDTAYRLKRAQNQK
ncbi:unnamed protein product [Mytilus coruscus]|uniref:Uncharacterized protein n=1 Tax=Mytilus coruscus TaxID=42192 RepID=A0A6J7ZVV0_MYTCO|nr:unnamed protein product [Mytilus coruscus]